MSKRIAAIVNPVSGRRDLTPIIRRMGNELVSSGASFSLHRTECPGDATRIARRLQDEADAVLVVGGDGTVCEVVNGLMQRKVPVLVFRGGTENLLARELDMPAAPDQIARTLLEGSPIPYDVGVLNDRRFLSVAGIGFDAECVLRMSATRRGHITHLDYFWPIWRTYWAHQFPRIQIEIDGRLVFDGRGFAILGILPRYSAGMRILAEAVVDDGLLDVCIFPCTGRRQMLGHAVRALAHRHVGRGGVRYLRGRHIVVTSNQCVPVEIDGDPAGSLPAEFTVLPHAARFLILRPAGADHRRNREFIRENM
jgi:YegS/Rv2252/BmrU family lipid kinase